MGAELGACAISHLECVSDAGMAAMARAGTVATLLPTTAYVLRIHPPPARRLIEAGVPFVRVARAWWDSHGQNFETHLELVPELDHVAPQLLLTISIPCFNGVLT